MRIKNDKLIICLHGSLPGMPKTGQSREARAVPGSKVLAFEATGNSSQMMKKNDGDKEIYK